jgi:hypothetical protein
MQPTRIGLLCLIIFISCKKEHTSLEYPSSYHRVNVNDLSFRVFAASSEITDPAIVKRFNASDSSTISYYQFMLDTIRILDNVSAVLVERYSYEKYFYSISGKNIRLESVDTLKYSSSGEVFTRTLNYQIGQYKPTVFEEYLISSTAGLYTFGYKFRNQLNLEKDKDQLRASWLVFVTHKGTGSYYTGLQNKLDPKFFKWIGANDTITVKEFSVIYAQ